MLEADGAAHGLWRAALRNLVLAFPRRSLWRSGSTWQPWRKNCNSGSNAAPPCFHMVSCFRSRRHVAVSIEFNCDCALQMRRLSSRIVKHSPRHVHVAGDCRVYARCVARLSLSCKRNVGLARQAHNAATASRASARERDSPPSGKFHLRATLPRNI